MALDEHVTIFFPQEWSPEFLQAKIEEVWKYCKKRNIRPYLSPRNEYYILEGCTQEEIIIRIIINQRGKVITAFPRFF